MVKLTQSLEEWLFRFHPELLTLIAFGHTEYFTEEMWCAYLDWLKTTEGRSYLKGGSNYKGD